MPQQQIYLTENLYLKLKQEKNMSSLISSLLEAHYSTPLVDKKDQLEEQMHKLKSETLEIEAAIRTKEQEARMLIEKEKAREKRMEEQEIEARRRYDNDPARIARIKELEEWTKQQK